ncbi:c-type cytochrome [Chitinophagaceae bacterium LB-8]|jgi:cytochrome c|uniref:C-type cytochrome n=1 Tax=Paraflavisolibacter caeni TaxID=2982496 RepID=A0A9X2XUB4_9BACT|nr:c-type cytochrome [Paraflavisolibacter caeni]MCU7549030.1 c-type cytochrome [Paraflavisolibacter caeni]
MKKSFIVFSVLVAMIACNSSGDKSAEEKTTETPATEQPAEAAPATDLSSNPDYVKGIELEAKNDCGTCHKIDEKLIGPPFREIAAKYPMTDENLDSLSAKVIRGGTGVWGKVPMTPHPNLSKDDAKAIVKYILLLKK